MYSTALYDADRRNMVKQLIQQKSTTDDSWEIVHIEIYYKSTPIKPSVPSKWLSATRRPGKVKTEDLSSKAKAIYHCD